MIRAIAFSVLAVIAPVAYGGSITGRVVESGTGTPLTEVQIRLQSVTRVVNSDASGWFALSDLEPGLYWAAVSGSYHERRFVRMAVGDTTVIELRRTSFPRFQSVKPFVDPTVPPTLLGIVRVRAVDEREHPIAGVSVHVDPGGFCLTDSSGWAEFPKASAGWHPIRIGSLLHGIQTDSVLVKNQETRTRQYVMRVREPYRGRTEVTLNSRGDLRIDDGSSVTVHSRGGGTVIRDRFPRIGSK